MEEDKWQVSWSLTSLFSTNMAISETKVAGIFLFSNLWRLSLFAATNTYLAACVQLRSHCKRTTLWGLSQFVQKQEDKARYVIGQLSVANDIAEQQSSAVSSCMSHAFNSYRTSTAKQDATAIQ